MTRHLFAAGASVLFMASLPAACSSKGGSSAPAAPVPEADYPLQAAHALCDPIKPCCAEVGYPYDPAACVANARLQFQAQLAGQAGTRNAGTYDANVAGACVANLRAMAAACTSGVFALTPAPCGQIYVGSKKLGDACQEDAECGATPGGRVYCYAAGVPGAAKCTLFKDAPVKGDPCGGTGTTITLCDVPSLYCDTSTGISTCQDRIAIGQPCQYAQGCATGGFCKRMSPTEVTGTCAPPAGFGEACSYGDCGAGLYCNDSGAGKCARQLKAGDVCGGGADPCDTGVCSNGKCSAGIATVDVCMGLLGYAPAPTDDAGTTLTDGG